MMLTLYSTTASHNMPLSNNATYCWTPHHMSLFKLHTAATLLKVTLVLALYNTTKYAQVSRNTLPDTPQDPNRDPTLTPSPAKCPSYAYGVMTRAHRKQLVPVNKLDTSRFCGRCGQL